jgi:hypothetical protein
MSPRYMVVNGIQKKTNPSPYRPRSSIRIMTFGLSNEEPIIDKINETKN